MFNGDFFYVKWGVFWVRTHVKETCWCCCWHGWACELLSGGPPSLHESTQRHISHWVRNTNVWVERHHAATPTHSSLTVPHFWLFSTGLKYPLKTFFSKLMAGVWGWQPSAVQTLTRRYEWRIIRLVAISAGILIFWACSSVYMLNNTSWALR